jgi:hypothetical protein
MLRDEILCFLFLTNIVIEAEAIPQKIVRALGLHQAAIALLA